MRHTPSTPPARAALRAVLLSLAFAPALLPGCGADPPAVPPAEPASDECQVPDPPAATPDPAAPAGTGRFLPPPQPKAPPRVYERKLGPSGLEGLRPQDGPRAGLPMTLPQMMATRHPPSDMQWRALPPGSDAALTSMIADGDEDPKARARAMHGLSVRAPDGGDATMRTVLADPKADGTVRRAAARALAHGYVSGKSGGEARQALITALADDDARLREATVKALAPHAADPAIRAALKARAEIESAPLVKEALTAALEESPAAPKTP